MKIIITSGGDCPGMNAFILELSKLCRIMTICEELNKTMYYSEFLKKPLNKKVHILIIGHQQRGGSPTAYDRYVAR